MAAETERGHWGHYWLFAFLLLYFLFEAGFVSFISPGAGLDDAELISNLSFWNWGYGGSQPPLYTWLAYGLTQAFGLHFWLLQLLRFTILASTFFAVYLGLRGLRVEKNLAAFASLSMFLLPQIAWESQRALIHSVLGTAGSAWSFAAFVYFVRKPCYRRALALGAAFAAAALGKYNGLIFIAALLLGGLFIRPARRALATRAFAVSLTAALALMAPALIFMALHPESVLQRAVKFHAGAGGNILFNRLRGLLDLGRAAVNFVLPAMAAAALIGFFTRRQKRKNTAANIAAEAAAGNGGGNAEALRFLRAALLCGLALCALMVLASGATHIKDRWLQPVLFLAPPYAALWLAQRDKTGRAPRLFGVLGLTAALLVPPMLYANLYARGVAGRGQGIFARYARAKPPIQNLDYPALYAQLTAAGGAPAVLLAPEPFIIGNLRLLNPQMKTLFAETPFAAQRLARPLVILWKEGEGGESAALPPKLAPILAAAGIAADALPPPQMSVIPYRRQGAGSQQSERLFYIALR